MTKTARRVLYVFLCAVLLCGSLSALAQAEAPAGGRVRAVSIEDVTVNYQSSAYLKTAVTADEGVTYRTAYQCSDPKVVALEPNGKVTGLRYGRATVTCTVTDENGNTVSDTCRVRVTYTFLQWIIVVLFFGWVWY